jgi:hypothetical protein
MSTPPSNDDFKSQFFRLGKNLEELIQSTWDSPERKKLQNELETGFTEVFRTLSRATAEFRASDTGQQLEHELDDLRDQMASGELTEKVRDEILHALQMVNAQIEQATGHWNAGQPSSQTSPPSDGNQSNSHDTPL